MGRTWVPAGVSALSDSGGAMYRHFSSSVIVKTLEKVTKDVDIYSVLFCLCIINTNILTTYTSLLTEMQAWVIWVLILWLRQRIRTPLLHAQAVFWPLNCRYWWESLSKQGACSVLACIRACGDMDLTLARCKEWNTVVKQFAEVVLCVYTTKMCRLKGWV